MTDGERHQYRVEGMTCGHCRLSVMEEVAEVPGVEDVDVDLESGLLTVRGADVSDSSIESAVQSAGYSLAPASSAASSSDREPSDD